MEYTWPVTTACYHIGDTHQEVNSLCPCYLVVQDATFNTGQQRTKYVTTTVSRWQQTWNGWYPLNTWN